MIKLDKWYRPYENFGPAEFAANIEWIKELRGEVEGLTEQGEEYALRTYHGKDFHVFLWAPVLDGYEKNMDIEGVPVYFPIRQPDSDEISRQYIADMDAVILIKNFGYVGLSFDIDQACEIHERIICPYNLFLRTPSGIYQGVTETYADDVSGAVESYFWRPMNNGDMSAGTVCVPMDASNLKTLEFQFRKRTYFRPLL